MSYLEKVERFIAKQNIKDLNHVLGYNIEMTLDKLSNRHVAIPFSSEILGHDFWLCSNKTILAQIRKDDPNKNAYTVDEMRKLISLKIGIDQKELSYRARLRDPDSDI